MSLELRVNRSTAPSGRGSELVAASTAPSGRGSGLVAAPNRSRLRSAVCYFVIGEQHGVCTGFGSISSARVWFGS